MKALSRTIEFFRFAISAVLPMTILTLYWFTHFNFGSSAFPVVDLVLLSGAVAVVLLLPWLGSAIWLLRRGRSLPLASHIGLAVASVLLVDAAFTFPGVASRWTRLGEVFYPSSAQNAANSAIETALSLAAMAAVTAIAIFVLRRLLRLETIIC